MDTIKIQGTDDTPAVVLDAENEVYQLEGRSLPEDVAAFYDPILDWLEDFSKSDHSKMTFGFKLEYFNTASSKLLLDILLKLEEMVEEGGKEILVKWYFPEDDEDMEEAGEEYADIVDIPFEQIPYED